MMKCKSYIVGLAAPFVIAGGSLLAASTTNPEATQSGREAQQEPVTTETKPQQEQSQEIAQQQAEQVSIEFATGSSQLTEQHKSQIKQALAATNEKDEIKIAVWSDKTWSAEAKKSEFTKEDKRLAEQRGKAIEEYINNTFPKKDLEVITMTEDIGFFAKVFNTEEAEIKSIFAKEGQQEQQESKENQEAILIRDNGGPSKAVIVVKRNQ